MKCQVGLCSLLLTKSIIVVVAVFQLCACSDGGGSGSATERDATAAASYSVTFTTVWDATNFPTNFPAGAHFTAMTGGTHNNQVVFWEPGQNASPGIESIAETGSQSLLSDEVDSAKRDGKAEFVLAASSGIGATGTLVLTFDINKIYPLVTLVSMVAPSPDWFVGVHNLSLFDNVTGDWRQTLVVDLAVYDAGTEEGDGFSLTNANTSPKTPISLLSRVDPANHDFVDGASFPDGKFIAKMIFTRTK